MTSASGKTIKPKIKVAIVGSRTAPESILIVSDALRAAGLSSRRVSLVVSGGARGADRAAERWAIEYDIPIKTFLPDWTRYGRSAGYIRNKQIVESSNFVIALWDGESRGTQHTINIAKQMGKKVSVFEFRREQSKTSPRNFNYYSPDRSWALIEWSNLDEF